MPLCSKKPMSPLLSAVLIAAMTAKGHDYGHILEKPVFF